MVLLRFFEILKKSFTIYLSLSVYLSSVAMAIYTQDYCLQIFSSCISGKVKDDLLNPHRSAVKFPSVSLARSKLATTIYIHPGLNLAIIGE